ncbi:hypothetical protein N7G274_008698 [Stereocaulon virgatum]|uniref:Adenine deaminase n=1 Tax=Stereocaulon virgatum TaxID=373712 RepID=A0ABR3ZZL4_9LECA
MCNSPLHPFLQSLPKCEHHMHLEGSLSPSLLFTLASRNKITLPASADSAFTSPETLLDRYTRFTSLDDFLRYYYISMGCLIYEADFEQLAWDYFVRAKSDGVMHAEVFFDPQAHTERGIDYETVVNGFEKACKRAEQELEVTTKLIMCFVRHLPVEHTNETYIQAEPHLVSGRLAGIGLDSSEEGHPPRKWHEVYGKAKKQGIRRTAHAGEEGPAEYIREALTHLDIERIDHGIRLADDKELMREVAERKMLVTMCPLSNLKLRCVKEIGELPIRTFLDSGVSFSINSDDPAYFSGYILDNYCAVQEAFGLTVQEWENIAKASVNGSWCDGSRKDAILKEVDATIMKFGNV